MGTHGTQWTWDTGNTKDTRHGNSGHGKQGTQRKEGTVSKIVVCLCNFYKNVWVKNKDTILITGLSSINSVFGRLCRKRSPGGGKTRGSGTEKRCAHKWFHTIFPCMDPCTNIFRTLSPPPPPQKPGRLCESRELTICVVRSDSILGFT